MKHAWSFIFALSVLLSAPRASYSQVPLFTLNRLDQAHLDSLAALTAKKIRGARLTEKEPKILVMDFFRNSPGTPSQLGTILADRFTESLLAYSSGMQIFDRKVLHEFLPENWTTLEDLKSYEICLAVARQLGATGAILGTLAENGSNIMLTLHLKGFGPTEKEEDDFFAWRDRTVSFPMTEELRVALYQEGPNYSRKAEEIPEELGVFMPGLPGVKQPQCMHCPDPGYSDAARAVKFQGTVVLSVLVTAEGQVSGIYVLKGAPFGLTDQAIKATKNWRFQPGQKDGKPSPVRVSVEIAFRLLSGPESD